MFQVFVTKHVSGWCGSNSKCSLWDTSISNVCPNCGLAHKTSKHLTWCTHVGRIAFFSKSVRDAIECHDHANVDVTLIIIIDTYLTGQGSITIESCVPPNSPYMSLTRTQDWLGWDCFVEGCIQHILIKMVRPFLHNWLPRISITRWGIDFIKSLLSVTHRQWLFWNADVHHRIEGLMVHQHSQLNLRIHALIQTSPEDLLPCHRHLLQQDFASLGNADTLKRQIWAASMESALGVASHFSAGHLTPGNLHSFFFKRVQPCTSKLVLSCHHNWPWHQGPRQPRQQTLPASFWAPRHTPLPPSSTTPWPCYRPYWHQVPFTLEKKVVLATHRA